MKVILILAAVLFCNVQEHHPLTNVQGTRFHNVQEHRA